ncbi:MAG: D-2-hydroxyacid dehydrogenase [Planctomycetota bacterium]
MANDRLRIWVQQQFDPATESRLRAALKDDELIRSEAPSQSNLSAAGTDAGCRSAHVVFGQPHPDDLLQSTTLRWAALSTAGYTRYDTDALRTHMADRGIPVTNASGVYDEPCAQHVLAQMLAGRRALPESADAQARHQWEYEKIRLATHLLAGTVAIFGFGAIGRRLTALLEPFGCEVVGVRRRVRGDEPVAMIETGDEPAVSALLGRADHVVNVLPAHPTTLHFFDADRLGLMRPSACYYSIGRGNTTDADALIAALSAGRLASAWLDVTDPEPLPADHALWHAPRCHITPHIAGGLQREDAVLVEHFLDNLERFRAGQTLADRVF